MLLDYYDYDYDDYTVTASRSNKTKTGRQQLQFISLLASAIERARDFPFTLAEREKKKE